MIVLLLFSYLSYSFSNTHTIHNYTSVSKDLGVIYFNLQELQQRKQLTEFECVLSLNYNLPFLDIVIFL